MRHIIFFALAGMAVPAGAQSRSAALDPAALATARQSQADFAACLSTRKPDRIARLIDLPVDSPEYRRIALALYETDNVCLTDGSLKYNPALFAGAIFDALYKRDFGYNGPSDFPASVSVGYVERYRAPYSADARQAIALESFGECVARAEPAAARQLLLSMPATAAEQQHFAALQPRFAACVVKDAHVAMSKSIVRGAVAEGLYRLSRAVSGAR